MSLFRFCKNFVFNLLIRRLTRIDLIGFFVQLFVGLWHQQQQQQFISLSCLLAQHQPGHVWEGTKGMEGIKIENFILFYFI